MATEILFFGSLTDITSVSKLMETDMADTDAVKKMLEEKYPSLQTAKYLMAVNRKMIQENTLLTPGDTIACMPPFSGG